MAYLERDFQRDFNKWCKHKFPYTAAFELKATKGQSIPFNAVQEHQLHALWVAKHEVLAFKIPDCGFQNPFDSITLAGVPAFVVIMFEAKTDKFFMIDVDDWIQEQENADRKSLRVERAAEIGHVCSLLSSEPLPYTLRKHSSLSF